MQAVILAAGMGRRLGEFTANNTKCMVEVNGERLIDRMLRQLSQHDLTRIVMVVGYEGKKLKDYVAERYPELCVLFVENHVYDKTNNIYSLWLARDYLKEEDTLLLESDLIFEDGILAAAIDSDYPTLALVSKYESWNDGTMVTIDDDNNIVNFISKKAFNYADTRFYYKTVNVYKFSRDFIVNHYLPFLDAYLSVLGNNEYYEQVLRVITLIDRAGLKALPVSGMKWYEIDDVQDLRIAETMFASPAERLVKIQHSYGGYWRYPGLLDFCYLVNPFFPSKRLNDEIKANFDVLLREYPSGMGVNSLLAGKYFGIRQEYACVGNGAAELIKALMEQLPGKMGVVYPTFEEYPNRLKDEDIVKFHPGNRNFAYTADDLIDFFGDKGISSLLLVNPDNPSGNFIPKGEVLKLAAECEARGVRLVVDESFVDFSTGGEENSLLRDEILESHPTMCVMKSISKSYGVPGLRLGVLASADTQLVKKLRGDVAIWNINSFAEFYMQIFGKYEADYRNACEKFRACRDEFYSNLSTVPFIRVIPSQANYFLCELVEGVTSHDLTLSLLADFNIYIKDCSSKKGFPDGAQYVRIAVRDREDNDKLVSAMKNIFKKG